MIKIIPKMDFYLEAFLPGYHEGKIFFSKDKIYNISYEPFDLEKEHLLGFYKETGEYLCEQYFLYKDFNNLFITLENWRTLQINSILGDG